MNRKTVCLLKHLHPSRSEAEYCNWLLARKQNKEIKSFRYIQTIQLYVQGKPWKSWAADFGVTETDGTLSIHESKGWNRSDDSFRMKLNLAMRTYPNMKFYVNKRLMTFTPKGRVVIRAKKRTMPKRLSQVYKLPSTKRTFLNG